jgi:hypothetical protein
VITANGKQKTRHKNMLTIEELITIRYLMYKVYDKTHEEQIVAIVDKIEQEIIKRRSGGTAT